MDTLDRSQVMDRHDSQPAEGVTDDSRWHFQPDDDTAPDLFFATEDEACAAQQGWRIARGCNPITGDRERALAGPDARPVAPDDSGFGLDTDYAAPAGFGFIAIVDKDETKGFHMVRIASIVRVRPVWRDGGEWSHCNVYTSDMEVFSTAAAWDTIAAAIEAETTKAEA